MKYKHQPLAVMKYRTAGLASIKSAQFGMVRNGGTRVHQGEDYQAEPGTPVFAVDDGVIELRTTESYGKQILLTCENFKGEYAFYAHLNAVHVENGQRVKAGEQIGLTGNTGSGAASMTTIAKGAHLHFEVRSIKWPYSTTDKLLGRINPAERTSCET